LIQCFYATEKVISQRPCPHRYEKKEEQANTGRTPPVRINKEEWVITAINPMTTEEMFHVSIKVKQ
jgi:hypothetical protein